MHKNLNIISYKFQNILGCQINKKNIMRKKVFERSSPYRKNKPNA